MPHDCQRHDSGKPPEKFAVSRRGFLKSLGASAFAAATFGTGTVATGLAATAGAAEAPKELGPGAVPVALKVNGKAVGVTVEPRVTLLEALRVNAGLTGAKEACDRASCGACTVLLNGEPVNACSVLAVDAQGAEIVTVEGLMAEAQTRSTAGLPLTRLQAALVEHDGMQCGYCTPGFVMTLHAFLLKNPSPTEAEVRRACAGNLCRCGSYPRIFAAVVEAGGRKAAVRTTVISTRDHALA